MGADPLMPTRLIADRSRRSPTLRALSDAAERAWWRLTTVCDDYGRFDADPEVLLATCFERKPAGWTVGKMARVLEEWAAVTPGPLIHLYQNGSPMLYGHALTFRDHQRPRESKPRFPEPPCRGNIADAAKCGESRQLAALSVSVSVSENVFDVLSSPQGAASPPPAAVVAGESDWPSPEALVRLYNTLSPDECPELQTLSAARRAKARAYLAQFPAEAWWRVVFQRIHRSRFLRGLKPKPGHEAFVADFDWLLTKGKDGSENAVKVHDGRYEDRG